MHGEQSGIALADGQRGELGKRHLRIGRGEHRQRPIDPMLRRATLPRADQLNGARQMHGYYPGTVKVGSLGSCTSLSRIQPSFSSLIDWIAMALALASRSGCA